MHEARICLPYRDNAGSPMPAIHAELEREICATFGGCTTSAARGSWLSPDGTLYREPVRVYDVAMDRAEAHKLRAIAVQFGRRARQEAVYFRAPSGLVQIIGLDVAAQGEATA